MRHDLTLNLGLRTEILGAFYDDLCHIGNFDLDLIAQCDYCHVPRENEPAVRLLHQFFDCAFDVGKAVNASHDRLNAKNHSGGFNLPLVPFSNSIVRIEDGRDPRCLRRDVL